MSSRSLLRVGLLYPQNGPAGLFGPSCRAAAELAVRDINSRGGLLGCPVEIVPLDSSPGPQRVLTEVDRLITSGSVHAIVGWHTSDTRYQLARALQLRVPYIYTAVYEGGESAPGVYLTGETPDSQIEPALRWLRDELGLRRWLIVGSDYRWGRCSARACEKYLTGLGLEWAGTHYRNIGSEDFAPIYDTIERARPDGVLMLLLGQDAVHFNRGFAERELDRVIFRYSSLMDENMLLASGPSATARLLVSAGYFESLVTTSSMEFNSHYFSTYGVEACLPTSIGESCYEGMLLLESLCSATGSTDMTSILANQKPVTFDGPRGTLRLDGGHTRQQMYLAEADSCDFSIITSLKLPS